MRKPIVALAASTLLIGMSLSAIPAFADDAPAASSGESSSAPAKHSHMKSHKHMKKSKKSSESSSAAPDSAPK